MAPFSKEQQSICMIFLPNKVENGTELQFTVLPRLPMYLTKAISKLLHELCQQVLSLLMLLTMMPVDWPHECILASSSFRVDSLKKASNVITY